MKKITIEIETIDASFGETHEDKLRGITMVLQELTTIFGRGLVPESTMDINGNTVARVTVE